MWTKHLTAEGKAFYFNASQNRSVWVPPSDSVIHEAPNLQRPTVGDETKPTQSTDSVPSNDNEDLSLKVAPQATDTLPVPDPSHQQQTNISALSGQGPITVPVSIPMSLPPGFMPPNFLMNQPQNSVANSTSHHASATNNQLSDLEIQQMKNNAM
jgi:hypothetical protein